MIASLHQMAVRALAWGIKLFGATLTPFGNETFLPGAWNRVREGFRVVFNQWIRTSGVLDGVVDFDQACTSPRIRPRCYRSTIAATGCTRVISDIAR